MLVSRPDGHCTVWHECDWCDVDEDGNWFSLVSYSRLNGVDGIVAVELCRF